MNDSSTDAFVIETDTDLTQEADNSIQTLYYFSSMLRFSVQDDLAHIQRILKQEGIVLLQAFLAPTKKHRPVYLEAVQSVLQGRRVHLYNEYEWQRFVKAANMDVKQLTKHNIPVKVKMDIPLDRIEKTKILLNQCPSDLLEFVEPTFPPQGRLGYIARELRLFLQKAKSQGN